MLKKDSISKKPILIVIAGPNGSGKTTITEQIINHEWIENCVYINPDNIAKEKFGDWNSKKFVLKAAKIATKMRYNCLKKQQSLIFETVLSSKEKIDFIQEAKNKGYFVRLFFINTNSPIINAKRVAQRVLEGGHDVPIEKIISRYSKSLANSYVAAKIVDRSYFYDNSIDNHLPQLILRTKEGKIKKKHCESEEWIENINHFLEKK